MYQIDTKDELSPNYQALYEKFKQILENGPDDAIIDITKYSARGLILVDQKINTDIFEPTLNANPSKKWPRYIIKIFDVKLYVTPKPQHGHVGNFFIQLEGIANQLDSLPYKDIIDILNNIRDCNLSLNPDSQEITFGEGGIARIMLQFMKKGPCFFKEINQKTPGDYTEASHSAPS